MNKHTKLAIVIAPFLAIGGYIATDYYDKYKVSQKRYHEIVVQGDCDIDQGNCLLQGAGLILEFTKRGELTNIESNYPLDSAAIGMTGAEKDKPYNLTPDSSKKNWSINTATYSNTGYKSGDKVRLIVTAKDHLFFSEFTSSK